MCLAAGIRRPRAPRETTGRRVEVAQLSRAHGRELIGKLSCQGGAFVFRYDLGYEGPPIAEFPRKDRPYRSEALWTFFVVRLPPTSREDVQEVVKSVNADDSLEMLAALGHVSVTNPYECGLLAKAWAVHRRSRPSTNPAMPRHAARGLPSLRMRTCPFLGC